MIVQNNFSKGFFRSLYIISLILITATLYSCSSSDKTDITSDDPEKAFATAKRNYDKKDYLQAIEDFSYIKLRFSGSNIVDKAQYYLAMSHYKREEYILAAYEFDYLLKNYPTSEYAEESRFNVAMCYYELSPDYELDQLYTRYAIASFQIFLDLYPDSKLSGDAEAKIYALRNKLAFKDLKSGELYVKLDDYRAAVVYYDHILEEYFDTDYADDALYNKIEVLIDKKKYEEASEEIERFEEKFKSSPLLSKVMSLKSRIP